MKIKRITPIAVSLPMIKPVKMSLEEVSHAHNVLVRLETDGGVVGWGEAASAPTMTGKQSKAWSRQSVIWRLSSRAWWPPTLLR